MYPAKVEQHNNYKALYKPVLNEYLEFLELCANHDKYGEFGMSGTWEHTVQRKYRSSDGIKPIDKFGYAYRDINLDGIQELIFLTGSESYNGEILMIYTLAAKWHVGIQPILLTEIPARRVEYNLNGTDIINIRIAGGDYFLKS